MSEFGPLLDRDPLPLEVERQVDRLSDEFERAWKAGALTPDRGLPGPCSGCGTNTAAR